MASSTHEFLRRERDAIMAEWERAIREEPRPILLEDSALRDDLPEFLAGLATWIDSGHEAGIGLLNGAPTSHAKQRLKHAYQLAQLISEFRVLRVVILRLLLYAEAQEQSHDEGQAGVERRVIELARLNVGLDQAISDSVECFVNERERIRERFIGVLSHDLRSPLSSILMSADQMLRSGQLPPGHDRLAGRIARGAARMSRMVRDMLDLARGRLGEGIPITPARMDMGEVCRTVVDDMSITAPGRQLSVETGEALWGEWDHDRALQAVGNLVANALQYGRDPVTVTATCGDGNVAVAVTNQGDPIPDESHARLFDPFKRGEAAYTDRQGLGLGLYIVSEIMRAHGGTVAVVSSRERGTTFRLTWPRSDCTPTT
jgi:signal transduction histidine kinase